MQAIASSLADAERHVLEGCPSSSGALDSSKQCEGQADATGLLPTSRQPRRSRPPKRALKPASKVTCFLSVYKVVLGLCNQLLCRWLLPPRRS
jgi:hypothetical protein